MVNIKIFLKNGKNKKNYIKNIIKKIKYNLKA